MAADISEKDWRHFRGLHEVALERFSQQILKEAAEVATAAKGTAHERYLALYQLLQRRNREMAEAFDDLRRSQVRFQLLCFRTLGVATDEEFAGFSDETRKWVLGVEEIRKSS